MKQYNSRTELHALENVKGTGISPHDDGLLIVFVTAKVDESALDDDDIVPPLLEIAGTQYRTDVRAVGIPHHEMESPGSSASTSTSSSSSSSSSSVPGTDPSDHRRLYSPTPGGVSLGNNRIGAGTVGSPRLTDADGDPVVLTNAHVTAGAQVQYHPASLDADRNRAVVIGELKEESPLEGKAVYRTDSALVRVDDPPDETVTDTILGLGRLLALDPRTPAGVTVEKAGRTTGVTSGELLARDVVIDVAYGPTTLRYEGIEAFPDMSGPGDSGSLFCRRVPGGVIGTSLLYAGSHQATFGIPLHAVMEEHGELTVPSADAPGDDDDDDDDEDDEDEDDGGIANELKRLLMEFLRILRDLFERVNRSVTGSGGSGNSRGRPS